MIFRKKTIIVAILLAAVAVAALISGSHNSVKTADSNSVQEDYVPLGKAEMVSGTQVEEDYFESARSKRQTDRDAAISLLNDTVNNTASSSQARKEASDKIAAIADNIIKESAAEDILKSKGYSDAVVHMAETEINVAVKSKELTEADVSKIRDVIIAQTN
ncbi:MAG: SpoIIIAH-like family protein, partial [Clostridia bacterium]|nr:SpoIIIAH-like family protein [Clostridia bacterium]